MNITDLTPNELREAIIEASRGDQVSRDILSQDLELWRDGLVEVVQGLDEQFTTKRVEINGIHASSLAEGSKEAKEKYHAANLKYEDWKAKTNGFRKYILADLRAVKKLIKENNIKQSGDENLRRDALREIDDILSKAETDTTAIILVAEVLDRVADAELL